MNLKNIMQIEKKPDTEEYILYDSIFIKCPTQINL